MCPEKQLANSGLSQSTLRQLPMSSGFCSSHVGLGTIKDGTAEAWRNPHPGAYKNLTPNAGQYPVQRSRKQNLWEKPAAQWAQHSLAVSHQPPGCLPHPTAVSVSVSLRATSSTSSHTTDRAGNRDQGLLVASLPDTQLFSDSCWS